MKIYMCDKNNPAVTIVTRTYNRPYLLERCIQSVLSLDYASWNHVIVINSGDDKSVRSLVDKYEEAYAGRSLVIYLEDALPLGAAINVGIRATHSDYIILLDDDDRLLPSSLSELVAEMCAAPASLKAVHCNTSIVDESVFKNKIFHIGERPNPYQNKFVNVFNLLNDVNYTPVTFLFERSVLNQIGYFDEKPDSLPEWKFWVYLLSHVQIGFVDKTLATWHNRIRSSERNYIHSDAAALRRTYKEKYIQRKSVDPESNKINEFVVLYLATSAFAEPGLDKNIYFRKEDFNVFLLAFIKALAGRVLRIIFRKSRRR